MRFAVAALLAGLLLPLPTRAQERPEAEPSTFTAELDVDGERESLPATPGVGGPLFLLQPFLDRFAIDLSVMPLEQSHRLRIAGTDLVFGPSSHSMTVGREIVTLRQPPKSSQGGLWVPLEVLEHSAELLGMDLRWFPNERVLEVRSRRSRDVELDIQVVHIQGVTTVVLHFDHTPTYQVAARGSVVDISLPVERVHLLRDPRPPQRSLLDRVEATEHRVRLFLVEGAVAAEPYVLAASPGQGAGGLRLVIDVSSSAPPPLQADATDSEPTLEDADAHDPPGLRTIVIDPGHGGVEQGAIGPAGTEEKELTLILAKALKRKLEERLAVQVVLTRNEDADLPLDTRTALANQTKGDLFISIHLNAAPESSAHGAETYFLAPQATDDRARAIAESENRGAAATAAVGASGDAGLQLLLWDLAQSQHLAASQSLARLIQEELNLTLGLTDRGVRQAPFAVLVGATMPAVLVELGFITNPKEESRLLDPTYRAELLDAVVRAVIRFKSVVDRGAESASVTPE